MQLLQVIGLNLEAGTSGESLQPNKLQLQPVHLQLQLVHRLQLHLVHLHLQAWCTSSSCSPIMH